MEAVEEPPGTVEEPPGMPPASATNGAGPCPCIPGDRRRPGELPTALSIGAEQWNDWHWHMHHRITSLEAIRPWVPLTADEEEAIARRPDPPFAITPYWASLIDPDDPDCPIRKQVVPRSEEFRAAGLEEDDSLHEDQMSPVPGLVHRYPDRVLVLATDQCVAYCRYCTRGRLVGTGREPAVKARFDVMLDYLRRTPQVRERAQLFPSRWLDGQEVAHPSSGGRPTKQRAGKVLALTGEPL